MSENSSDSGRSTRMSRSIVSTGRPRPKPKKQTPQAEVDQFWQKFTSRYPGKISSILPSYKYGSKKAQSSPIEYGSGSQQGKSYDQAAEECRSAVIKIAKECRRTNSKYRDIHFDIEFDLKRHRRDCLDGLTGGHYDMYHKPRSVRRAADLFENPQFFLDEATASDIKQGSNGDCWFLAALCALSNKKRLIDTICIARDEKVGVYGFLFHRDGEWIQTIIDDQLYLIASDWWESSEKEKRTMQYVNGFDAEEQYQRLNQTGSKALYFAQCRSENETWLPLLEKAFAKAHGDYQAIDGGFTGEAIEDLTGGVTTELYTTDILDKEEFWKNEILKVNDEYLFGCATGTFDTWQGSGIADRPNARRGVIRLHAYSILDAVEVKGQRLVKVRNPWGTDEWRGAWSDGSEQWTGEWMQLLNHRFGDDGVFWISYEDLLQKYSHFERTRLFDKSWNIIQQYTTVSVPWTADYNDTKFSVTFSKGGPAVIVLTQLDERYFHGLTGQYAFELHFRLEKDGSNDYIVRSHGNYSMRRSVSVDLELEAGTYSVLMKITATRNEIVPLDPQSVIRQNVKYRQNKLIQVGLAYELAHAKSEVRETAEEKAEKKQQEEKRKEAEKKQAKAEVRKQRLKAFERRKREKAREKRHKLRVEERRQKKQKAAPAPGAASEQQTSATESKAQDTAGDEGKSINGVATTETTKDEAVEPSNLPTPPPNNTNGPSNPPADPAPPGPPTEFDEPDSSYDSDTSFVSSIDSILDLPDPDLRPFTPPPRSPPADLAGPGNPNPSNDNDNDEDEDEDDAAIAANPWNAMCVVGLRVYSKDERCVIKVVRPKGAAGLDLDDASKGESGEKGDETKVVGEESVVDGGGGGEDGAEKGEVEINTGV